MKKCLAALSGLFLFLSLAVAQSPFSAQAERDTHAGQPAVRVSFDFPAEHHLYSSFAVTDAQGNPLTALEVPPPDTHKPDDLEPSYSAGFDAFYAPPADDKAITVSFQGCAGSLCFMPQEETFELDETVVDELEAVAAAGAQPVADLLATRGEPQRAVGYQDVTEFLAFLDPDAPPPEDLSAWRLFLKDPGEFYLQKGILLSVLLILLGGFLLNLTPCVLPMIPVNLAIIGATSAEASKGARFGLGLVYGLGMALVYGALGLVVVLSGSVFGSLNASPVFNGVIAILFFVLALAMFDVWHLDFSRFRKSTALSGRVRIPAVLVMGGISALLAGACVAPVLIAVLALSSTLYAKGVVFALFLPFLLGIGMALPWPLAAAGLAVLPKPGAWMDRIKKLFGVLILLLAVLYAWNTLQALRSGSETSETASALQIVDLQRDPPGTLEALISEAVASGKPILIDFGANWCKVCHLMDATTLRDPAVVAKLEDIAAIQILADTPNKSPAQEILQPLGIQGFPTFLLYPAP
jgi:thioredoxin:protein disulfide reductase